MSPQREFWLTVLMFASAVVVGTSVALLSYRYGYPFFVFDIM